VTKNLLSRAPPCFDAPARKAVGPGCICNR
jgi:hypothetical protein